jgi:hypothetical protein
LRNGTPLCIPEIPEVAFDLVVERFKHASSFGAIFPSLRGPILDSVCFWPACQHDRRGGMIGSELGALNHEFDGMLS